MCCPCAYDEEGFPRVEKRINRSNIRPNNRIDSSANCPRLKTQLTYLTTSNSERLKSKDWRVGSVPITNGMNCSVAPSAAVALNQEDFPTFGGSKGKRRSRDSKVKG